MREQKSSVKVCPPLYFDMIKKCQSLEEDGNFTVFNAHSGQQLLFHHQNSQTCYEIYIKNIANKQFCITFVLDEYPLNMLLVGFTLFTILE